MLKTRKISDRIVLVSADSQVELCRTFMRFQEHYENPEFKGKTFTEGQLRAWYASNSDSGASTYEHDVFGFNIPSFVLDPFIKGLFDPLTPLEAELVSLFRYRQDNFYLIGAQEDGIDQAFNALEHEICHGLYFTEPAYRKACLAIVDKHRSELDPVLEYLKKKLYHPDVFDDECHAFISADLDWLKEKRGVDALHLRPAQKALRKVRARFPVGQEGA